RQVPPTSYPHDIASCARRLAANRTRATTPGCHHSEIAIGLSGVRGAVRSLSIERMAKRLKEERNAGQAKNRRYRGALLDSRVARPLQRAARHLGAYSSAPAR